MPKVAAGTLLGVLIGLGISSVIGLATMEFAIVLVVVAVVTVGIGLVVGLTAYRISGTGTTSGVATMAWIEAIKARISLIGTMKCTIGAMALASVTAVVLVNIGLVDVFIVVVGLATGYFVGNPNWRGPSARYE